MAGEFMSIHIFGYAFSSQLWLRMTGYLNYLSSTYVFISSFVSLKKYVGRNWTLWCGYVWQESSCLHIFTRTVIWMMSYLLTANNRPEFLWGVGSYAFVYLLRSNQYISNQYILDWNLRLSSYTIGVTYSDYISLLILCGNFPLTYNTGGYWNLLESTPARIPLIKSSHKCTWMLFIIPNSKIGIWLCSQPIIDINSQSNFNDVLTRPYKYLVQQSIQEQNALKTIYMLVSPGETNIWIVDGLGS